MRYATQLEPDDIHDYVRSGITPLALEMAHKSHTVRELGKRCDANQYTLKALADRWGVEYK